ncbi:transcriptional regulator [Rhodoferax lacus]|uniref:Transcriptional regulator n=1 Tax=Rhodoferax lacus TaxID=2184758 RepID=A0A3E1R9H8_9BURK|nr:helix-turn-helix transcriptional regulator [Rhodoferax lacus]RFO96029.1 transcriptional regulator [Rhodoferax lacus]
MQNDDVEFKKTVGQRVKRLRLGSGATQDTLAERCGIYRTYLSRIEAGAANPTLVVLGALAAALNVDLCELFCDFEKMSAMGLQRTHGAASAKP